IELVTGAIELADFRAQIGEVVTERQLRALAPERPGHGEATLVARERRAEIPGLMVCRAEVEQTQAGEIVEPVALGERERTRVALGGNSRAPGAKGEDRERGAQAARVARRRLGVRFVEQLRELRFRFARSPEIARGEPDGFGERAAQVGSAGELETL